MHNALTGLGDAFSAAAAEDVREKYGGYPPQIVAEGAGELGLDISQHPITILTEEMLGRANRVIVLCDKALCPQWLRKHPHVLYLPVEDPYKKGEALTKEKLRIVRDQIVNLVENRLKW